MALSWFERLCIWILSMGMHKSMHMSFIMDGNRRYAKEREIFIYNGHQHGFQKLNQVIEVCMALGVRYVSVFAFALANFNRSHEEVEMLLQLIYDKLNDQHWINEFLNKQEIRICITGDMRFIPSKLRNAIQQIQLKTKHYNRMMLNVCVAYGGRYEMFEGIKRFAFKQKMKKRKKMKSLVKQQKEEEEEDFKNSSDDEYEKISSSYSNCLMMKEFPPPNLLIRTSGENRLSDFLIYQCSECTYMQFLPTNWPNLSVFQILKCILHYQVFSSTS